MGGDGIVPVLGSGRDGARRQGARRVPGRVCGGRFARLLHPRRGRGGERGGARGGGRDAGGAPRERLRRARPGGGARGGAGGGGVRGLAVRPPGQHGHRPAPHPRGGRDSRTIPHPSPARRHARRRPPARPRPRLRGRGDRRGAGGDGRSRRPDGAASMSAAAREFWVSSGHHLTQRTEGGGLAVTDELLLAYLARPELMPPDDACAGARALHASLIAAPRRPVARTETAGIADADARENWQAMLAFRDRLLAAPTIEAAYLDLVPNRPRANPPLF